MSIGSVRIDLCFSVCVNSVLTCFPVLISILVSFSGVTSSMVATAVLIIIFFLPQDCWREDDSCHFEHLLEAEFPVQTLRGFVLVSDDDEGLVASLDDQASEVLGQVYAIATNEGKAVELVMTRSTLTSLPLAPVLGLRLHAKHSPVITLHHPSGKLAVQREDPVP